MFLALLLFCLVLISLKKHFYPTAAADLAQLKTDLEKMSSKHLQYLCNYLRVRVKIGGALVNKKPLEERLATTHSPLPITTLLSS